MTVDIPIHDDAISEPTERFEVAIVEAQVNNAYLLKPIGVVSILSNEMGKRHHVIFSLCMTAILLHYLLLWGTHVQILKHADVM